MRKRLEEYRGLFDVSSIYGYFLPLLIPFFLWLFSFQNALHDTGLIAERCTRTNAVVAIASFNKNLQAPKEKEPIITMQVKEDGIRESRLVVREMGFGDVSRDVYLPFIIPFLAVVLAGGFFCALILHSKTKAGIRTVFRFSGVWRNRATTALCLANTFVGVYYLGIPGIQWLLEHSKL